MALYQHITTVMKAVTNMGHQVKVKLCLRLLKRSLIFFRKALFKIGYTKLALEGSKSPSFGNRILIRVTLSNCCLNETLLRTKIILFKLVTYSICQT